ncbi:hypothetical protein ACHAPD_012306, partial [Fusarium lateritium]
RSARHCYYRDTWIRTCDNNRSSYPAFLYHSLSASYWSRQNHRACHYYYRCPSGRSARHCYYRDSRFRAAYYIRACCRAFLRHGLSASHRSRQNHRACHYYYRCPSGRSARH